MSPKRLQAIRAIGLVSEGTGQIVMAVSQTVSNGFEKTYILRYVTSLEFINDKLMKITLFAVSIGGAVLALVLAFSIGWPTPS